MADVQCHIYNHSLIHKTYSLKVDAVFYDELSHRITTNRRSSVSKKKKKRKKVKGYLRVDIELHQIKGERFTG